MTIDKFEGWRSSPISFIEEALIDPETGAPFVLLPAERDFLQHAFKRDVNGRMIYPELIFSAPKKSGKTTLAAIFVITLMILFGGAFPEGICCANSQEQSTGRVFMMIRRIIEASPLLSPEATVTANKITIAGGSIIAIPSDASTAAGSNQNIAVFDELWAFDLDAARRLFDELMPVPTRKIACRLTVTYAGFSSEFILLEELYKYGLSQPEIAPSLHAGNGILMAWHHLPVAPWQTEAWIEERRRTLSPSQFLRLIENKFVTSENVFVTLPAWDRIVNPNIGFMPPNKQHPVFIGIDAGIKHDSTGILAMARDGSGEGRHYTIAAHRIFQPSPDRPLDFEATIEKTILDWCKKYYVVKILFDPYQMTATAQRLAKTGLPIEEFPQSSPNLTAATQNLYDLIMNQQLVSYPDEAIRLAISRAVAVETSRGWRISKDKQSHKIDVVVALAMAAHAAVTCTDVRPYYNLDALAG